MKTSLKSLCVLLFFITHIINASFSQTRIEGLITDLSGKPFPSANVILIQSADSVMVKGTISDARGSYFFENILPGKYRITASFIGYQQFYTEPIDITTAGTIKQGPIRLKELGVNLDEVVVSAKKPLYELKA